MINLYFTRRRPKRKPVRPRLPNQAERLYLGAMRRFAASLNQKLRDRLTAAGVRLDANIPSDVSMLEHEVPLELVGREVLRHGKRDAKRVLGLADTELVMGRLLDEWRNENVALIRNLTADAYEAIDQLILESRSMRVEYITDRLAGLLGDSTDPGWVRGRAELIARDQTLKLNGQIARESAKQAGIEEYIWSTSQDGSVRDEHAELEGVRCRYDNPPASGPHGEPGHPGDWYQCRCVAVPVLPELEGLEEIG